MVALLCCLTEDEVKFRPAVTHWRIIIIEQITMQRLVESLSPGLVPNTTRRSRHTPRGSRCRLCAEAAGRRNQLLSLGAKYSLETRKKTKTSCCRLFLRHWEPPTGTQWTRGVSLKCVTELVNRPWTLQPARRVNKRRTDTTAILWVQWHLVTAADCDGTTDGWTVRQTDR